MLIARLVSCSPPAAEPPQVIRITDHLIAVNKPSGLATQAPSGIDSMEVRVKRYLAQLDGTTTGGKTYLGVPHRLDRPASGAIVFARDKKTARFLAEQFQNRRVQKTYWALVTGQVSPVDGTWTDWMRKIPDEPRSEICAPDTGEARSALLHYRVLASDHNNSLLEIDLETGRSHQIRLQASTRGHPILGDQLYGADGSFGPRHADTRRRGIALHARQLEIVDPETREPLIFVAPLPEYWPDLLESGPGTR